MDWVQARRGFLIVLVVVLVLDPWRQRSIRTTIAAREQAGTLRHVTFPNDPSILADTGPPLVHRYRGFLPKSPAGRTVVAGVFVEAAGFCDTLGVALAAGRLEFSFEMTESLKS